MPTKKQQKTGNVCVDKYSESEHKNRCRKITEQVPDLIYLGNII
jgi:hypothetical protein